MFSATYPYPPHGGHWKFQGHGVKSPKFFKECIKLTKAKLYFPEGWGGGGGKSTKRKNLSRRGVDVFCNNVMSQSYNGVVVVMGFHCSQSHDFFLMFCEFSKFLKYVDWFTAKYFT